MLDIILPKVKGFIFIYATLKGKLDQIYKYISEVLSPFAKPTMTIKAHDFPGSISLGAVISVNKIKIEAIVKYRDVTYTGFLCGLDGRINTTTQCINDFEKRLLNEESVQLLLRACMKK